MVRFQHFLIVALVCCAFPSLAQDRGGYDPAERLKAMDTNNDGKLEEEEIPERFRSFMKQRFEEAGLDPSKPVDITAYLEAREQRDDGDRRDGDRDRRDGDRDRRDDRKKDEPLVPGFGETVDLPAVPGFGGDLGAGAQIRASGIPLEDQYHERIVSYVEGILKRYDRNGDQILDQDEWRQGRWRDPSPEDSDLNKDGRLTRQELCQRISKYDEFASLSRSSSGSSSSGSSGSQQSDRDKYKQYADSLVSRYDENKNGVLEEGEWKKMSGYHHQADANGDKVITRDELMDRLASYANRSSRGDSGSSDSRSNDREPEPGESYRVTGEGKYIRNDTDRLPKGLPDWFARNDANADGQISMAEFSVSWTEEKLTEFRKYDSNQDGILTPQECTGTRTVSSSSSRSTSPSSSPSSRSSSPSSSSRYRRN